MPYKGWTAQKALTPDWTVYPNLGTIRRHIWWGDVCSSLRRGLNILLYNLQDVQHLLQLVKLGEWGTEP
jgi:hypothetical protein